MTPLLLIVSFIVVVGLIVVYSVKYGITPTPTSSKVKIQLFKLLPELQTGEIIEMGSGWGTLAFPLARHFPYCKVVALEISPIPYLWSWFVARFYSLPNLTIMRSDCFEYPLQEASLVVCYLYPRAMEKLKMKFEKELAAGAYVITHTFAVPGWKPQRTIKASDVYHTPIYLYQVTISTS